MPIGSPLNPSDTFIHRHIGPSEADVSAMLDALTLDSLEALVADTVPEGIRMTAPLQLGGPRGEHELLQELRTMANQNLLFRSLIGMGYSDTITPPVILRNVLENPGWYTQYTPYQAEIAQGRLEALLNFQTMVADLCGLPLANSSLLDEATAAAEAMTMALGITRGKKRGFFAATNCHPQTLSVLKTRAEPIDVVIHEGTPEEIDFEGQDLFGVLVQYPATDGRLEDFEELARQAHEHGALLIVATDLLALCLLRPPGEFGADIAVGNSQRFGVPLGFGGPHAGFLATDERHTRRMPGRLVGLSRDSAGNPAYRLAVQTREQHIRRDRATSNICTAQVLLAIVASMYGVYHGPEGLKRIAARVHGFTRLLSAGIQQLGHEVSAPHYFDTLRIQPQELSASDVLQRARDQQINLRDFGDGTVGISLDEKTNRAEIASLLDIFTPQGHEAPEAEALEATTDLSMDSRWARTSKFLTHPVFERFHAEHEMLRYLNRLQARDLSLATSMIPLGSCTMKLNATSEMLPISWPELNGMHPFAPREQALGYQKLFDQLEAWLAEITGFAAVSLQPNAGSQGEYAGLLTIRAWHQSQGQERDICLVPVSAHGTNPASAVMAGLKVVGIACDEDGNIDVADLRAKAEQHRDHLAALMITYPSTHGVFEESVSDVCAIVHENGGQVYMDGANMNAQVGLCRPGDVGADVCHLNLHKTFCIPHGGGGPGMGPIAVAKHLAPFLPGHPCRTDLGGSQSIGPVSAAPYGSPSILPISWVYIALMGGEGLTRATKVAILNANYMAHRLREHYPILFTGTSGRVAHEFVIDLRPFKADTDVTVEDVAKRLMDFGFHAPTMSWPVAGTLMIEPTESESRAELDRFCEAMIAIRQEIQAIADERMDRQNNPLKQAPHTAGVITASEWNRPYSREQAAFPTAWLREHKFWPPVGRVDNAFGDRNLVCSCPSVEEWAGEEAS
ncbi:MAG TPA: glycine dehydrogenase (aminomethyl-transferring) [Deltaproteobacteria bacterium]|nr:glycine dehydrogenase (aminomethyl-transferring) [Deltaproteobacteria bacterium]HCP44615.1 glycine dehydrogenase (aminomethyl-transferring) [Deltaproteobacteria bacterium]